MKKTVIVLADTQKKKVADFLPSMRPWLESLVEIRGWYHCVGEIETDKLPVDYVLLFGGDGLLLAAARLVAPYRVPVVGVNFGKLGFLTEFTAAELAKDLPKVLTGEHPTAARMMLQCQVMRGGSCVYSSLALNDAVIKRDSMARMLYTQIHINAEEIATAGGDGIIVSSPVGSTAYCLSAGGPVLSPSLHALIIIPVCAHTLTLRPLVVSSEDKVEISLMPTNPGKVMLIIDGQLSFPLENADKICISRASQDFYLVESKYLGFFHILRQKLMWGEERLNL